MSQLLTVEDSERVADALIEEIQKISDAITIEVESGALDIRKVVKDFLIPETAANWNADWLPFTIEDMSEKIVSAISHAAMTGNLIKKASR